LTRKRKEKKILGRGRDLSELKRLAFDLQKVQLVTGWSNGHHSGKRTEGMGETHITRSPPVGLATWVSKKGKKPKNCLSFLRKKVAKPQRHRKALDQGLPIGKGVWVFSGGGENETRNVGSHPNTPKNKPVTGRPIAVQKTEWLASKSYQFMADENFQRGKKKTTRGRESEDRAKKNVENL